MCNLIFCKMISAFTNVQHSVLFVFQKLRCILEGGPHKPVTLTLTGMCIGNPPVREGQHFSSNVRVKDTKNLTIANRSNQSWHLKPIIEGEQWSGPVSFVVEPQQTKQYEITYYPLTMTSEGKKHQVYLLIILK